MARGIINVFSFHHKTDFLLNLCRVEGEKRGGSEAWPVCVTSRSPADQTDIQGTRWVS